MFCSIVITESPNRAGEFSPAGLSGFRKPTKMEPRGISSAIHLNAIKQRHVGAYNGGRKRLNQTTAGLVSFDRNF